jgi:hypothetical protein
MQRSAAPLGWPTPHAIPAPGHLFRQIQLALARPNPSARRWEAFKPPALPPPPAPPPPPPLVLPMFQEPVLPSDAGPPPPELLPVPAAPRPFKDAPLPEFCPPPPPEAPPFQAPPLALPPAPAQREAPRPPAFGNPRFGYDWSGERPFKVGSRSWFAQRAAAGLESACYTASLAGGGEGF